MKAKILIGIIILSIILLSGCNNQQRCSFSERHSNMIIYNEGVEKNITTLDNKIYCCNERTNECFRNPNNKSQEVRD